jgi:hypothetical protein
VETSEALTWPSSPTRSQIDYEPKATLQPKT